MKFDFTLYCKGGDEEKDENHQNTEMVRENKPRGEGYSIDFDYFCKICDHNVTINLYYGES